MKEYIKEKESTEINKKDLLFKSSDTNTDTKSKNFADNNKNSLIIKIPKNLNLFQDKDNHNDPSYLSYKNINKSSNNIFINNNKEKLEENPHMTISNSIYYNNTLYPNWNNLYVKKRTTTSIKTRNNHSVNTSKKNILLYEKIKNNDNDYLMYTLYQNNYFI